ncbi:MAG: IgGFc-binding protein, partial [Bacteroidota bacterium]
MRKLLLVLFLCLRLFFFGFNQTVTNVGTEFWVAFPPNQSTAATIKLYISSNFSTSGTVASAYPGVNQNFTVVPGIVTQLTLPSTVTLTPGINDKGINILAPYPMSAYGLNRQAATTDAYLALPMNALGLDYRVVTYKTTIGSSGSAFSVVATQNGTALTIFNHQTNLTTNINLDQGQTYHVEATTNGEDLTGSRIQSNFPVAVYGSVKCTNIPSGCSACDHIVEEMFPYYSWGKNFVTVPLAGRDLSGDIFRIVAAQDGTDISVNGTTVATINTGDYYETNLIGYNSISTSKATILAQFAKGITCTGNITGDPFMMLISPKEQFLTNYTICNVTGFTTHWVNVVAPDYALGTIYQDGVLIPNAAFIQIGTTNYYGAQRSVTDGSHTFNSTSPFGVFVYGWASADSYGYPGGGSLAPVGTVNGITLSPDTSYGQLNVTNVCLTAHVFDNNNNPVVGVLVNFNVSGITPLIGNAYTGALGDAVYCYTQTGVTPGTDHIYAEVFGFKSDTSVVIWGYNPPCTNPTSGGLIGNNQSGCGSYTPATLSNLTLPTGQTGTLEYKWQMSTTSGSSGFADIASTNSMNYAPGIVSQTTWYKRISKVNCLTSWSGAVESNVVELTVTAPLPVSVSINPSANNICAGTQVTFTATPNSPGLSPAYQWKVNGVVSGLNLPNFTYIPVNGDIVTCRLTSSETCASNNPAFSNSIMMTVFPLLTVTCTVTASENPVCQGKVVTFNAIQGNGGVTPSYQWKVNGVNVGTNSSVFAYIPLQGDNVTCFLFSSETCTSMNPVSGNTVNMIVNTNLQPGITITASPNPFCAGASVSFSAVGVNGG